MKLDVTNEHNARYLAMLPQWRCHKVVSAGKISLMARDEPNGKLMVHAEPSNMPFAVPLDFLYRHNPTIGGYFVVYEDGYISYSPAAPFEAGYHPLEGEPDAKMLQEAGKYAASADWALNADETPAQPPLSFKWRKRPVVIEAFQWNGEHGREMVGLFPEWLVEAAKSELVKYLPMEEAAEITTLEGKMRAERGDWIIRGVKGELYPCKPDIFAATYEPAEPLTGGSAGDDGVDLKTTFMTAYRQCEQAAYDYSHSLPEGPERELALKVYHTIRLAFSKGKSGLDVGVNLHNLDRLETDMPPHQLRVMEELADLAMKLQKLTVFFDTDTYRALDVDERGRLKEQSLLMQEYQRVLIERVAAFQ